MRNTQEKRLVFSGRRRRTRNRPWRVDWGNSASRNRTQQVQRCATGDVARTDSDESEASGKECARGGQAAKRTQRSRRQQRAHQPGGRASARGSLLRNSLGQPRGRHDVNCPIRSEQGTLTYNLTLLHVPRYPESWRAPAAAAAAPATSTALAVVAATKALRTRAAASSPHSPTAAATAGRCWPRRPRGVRRRRRRPRLWPLGWRQRLVGRDGRDCLLCTDRGSHGRALPAASALVAAAAAAAAASVVEAAAAALRTQAAAPPPSPTPRQRGPRVVSRVGPGGSGGGHCGAGGGVGGVGLGGGGGASCDAGRGFPPPSLHCGCDGCTLSTASALAAAAAAAAAEKAAVGAA